jgi:hypothetical protein
MFPEFPPIRFTEKTRPCGENGVNLAGPAVAALPRGIDVRRLFPGNAAQRRDYTRVSMTVKSKYQNVTIPPGMLGISEAGTGLAGSLPGGAPADDFALDKTFRHGLASAHSPNRFGRMLAVLALGR